MQLRWIVTFLIFASACATSMKEKPPPPAFQRIFETEWQNDNAAWIDFSSDGTGLLLASHAGKISVYTGSSGRPVEHVAPKGLIGAGFFDDSSVYIAGRERVTFWNTRLSDQVRQVLVPALTPDLTRTRVALSRSGRYVAIDDAAYDASTRRWALDRIGHGHQTALAFAGDAYLLTAGFHDRNVVVRPLSAGQPRIWKAPGPVVAAMVTSDGKMVVAVTRDVAVTWNPATDEPQHDTSVHEASDARLCGQQIVAVLGQRSVQVLSLPALDDGVTFDLEADGTALACDDTLLTVGDQSGRVYAWDLNSRRLVAQTSAFRGRISLLAAAAAQRRVFALSNDEQGAHGLLLQVPRP